jgi:hypothetical protein
MGASPAAPGPVYSLQFLGIAHAIPAGFPLLSLARPRGFIILSLYILLDLLYIFLVENASYFLL